MCNKMKLMPFLILLALAPDRVMAQTTSYSCTQGSVCIDSITAVPPAVPNGGGSIIVHWVNVSSVGKWDFFQITYAYPGSAPTQVKLGGGIDGVYNLTLAPSADPNGVYTFAVQGCLNQTLSPALCYGGNHPPWDVESFTLAAPPPPVATSKTRVCPAGLQLVDSPCTCIPGLNQSSACDAAGTEDCLSTAQVAKVPKCPGTQYLVCGNLPSIASRDGGGNWFNKVTLKCQAVQASNSPSGKSGPPPKGTGLPISNQQNKKNP
jgi:hypothetical protein